MARQGKILPLSPIPRRRVYRIMKEAGLLRPRKKRIEARARQEGAKLCQLLPKRPNELWQTDVTCVRIPGYGWPLTRGKRSAFQPEAGGQSPHPRVKGWWYAITGPTTTAGTCWRCTWRPANRRSRPARRYGWRSRRQSGFTGR